MPPQQVQAVDYNGPIFNPRSGKEDYFFYQTQPTDISSVATPQQSLIQFDADSQFLCVALSYQASIIAAGAGATLTEATNVIPLVTVYMADGGSGKYLMNAPVPLAAIAGDGKRPYRFIGPRVFQPNSTLNINWATWVAAGTTYRIQLVLHGVKLYS